MSLLCAFAMFAEVFLIVSETAQVLFFFFGGGGTRV
jgi:hypothetical protein